MKHVDDWLLTAVAKQLCNKVRVVQNSKPGGNVLVSLVCCMYWDSGKPVVYCSFFFSLNPWEKKVCWDGDTSMREHLMHHVTDTLEHLNSNVIRICYAIPELITEPSLIMKRFGTPQETYQAWWQVILNHYDSSLFISKFKCYLQIKLLRSWNNCIFRQVIVFPNAFCLKINCAKLLLIALLFFIKEHTLYTQRNHLENIYIS